MNPVDSLKVVARGDLEIVITRTFAAPREVTFEAMTRSDLMQRWLTGPPGWSMPECENDLRVGGAFRHVWVGPDGMRMSMTGKYREVTPPIRLVRVETFDFGCEAQAGAQTATLELEEMPGGTSMTLTVLYPSKEARDGALASGMEQGLGAGYGNLDAVLTTMGS